MCDDHEIRDDTAVAGVGRLRGTIAAAGLNGAQYNNIIIIITLTIWHAFG